MRIAYVVLCSVLVLLSQEVLSQSTSGESTTTGCSPSSGSCAQSGSSNYHVNNLNYNTTSGKFNGTITTNLCMNHYYGKINGTVASTVTHSASCIKQTFPAPAYTTTPVAAAIRGRVGLTIGGGVNIYGPMDAGFTTGQVCSTGSCPAGTDLEICTLKLLQECSTITWAMLLDDCGGHANAYHFHGKLACDYNTSITTSHSTLIGVAMDGRGIYGKYEGAAGAPTDLDACNGHYGDVPAYSDGTYSYAAATGVYHYHITDNAPFTVGCFGPVSSVDQCKSLYSTCGTGYSCFDTTKGRINYDTDCPCYQQGNVTYNQDYTSTCNQTAAPTAAPTYAPTVAPTAAPTSTPAPTDAPTAAPTNAPTTASPTATSGPTVAPTASPTTLHGSTPSPTSASTKSPTSSPTKSAVHVDMLAALILTIGMIATLILM